MHVLVYTRGGKMDVCIYVYICSKSCTYEYVKRQAHTHVCIHTFMHAYIHTYIHTHMHTYIHV